MSEKYDPRGNRVRKYSTINGDRYYIVDIAGKLPTILCEIDPTDSSLKNSYIYANGQPLCQYQGETDPNRYFYIHDRLGSVRLVVNDAADVNNSYTYSPFGELFTAESAETTENPFRFTGQWFDDEIGQYYLRARQYSTYLGRFTSRDPVAGKYGRPLTLHRYLYCINGPLNRIDPTGKLFWQVFGALTAGTAVRAAATLTLVAGINSDNDLLFNAGLEMHHLVAPAMFLGMVLGPALPYGGELAMRAVAGMWEGTAGAAMGLVETGAIVAREMALYVMTHHWTIEQAVDAIQVFADYPGPITTVSGGIALWIKDYVESNK
jgi:RHS repeat-associated protein